MYIHEISTLGYVKIQLILSSTTSPVYYYILAKMTYLVGLVGSGPSRRMPE